MAEYVKKTSQELKDYCNYFFANAYLHDMEKAKYMPIAVHKDLLPFSNYISPSRLSPAA